LPGLPSGRDAASAATAPPTTTTATDSIAAATARGLLADVPFHPQELHQCGPAALATVLGASGLTADPADLTERVYVPGRRGSFQAELVATTRILGRIPYVIDGSLDAIAAEVAAGRPVLVLQNLALPSLPRWHYAVVIGVDRRRVTLRSGRKAALAMSHRAFLRSWNWAGRWGLVSLRPGEWPARPDAHRWLATLSDLEQVGQSATAAAGYEAAALRWPTLPLPWFALGNARYRAGDRAGAQAAYARATEVDPSFAPGWNNLAQVLGELGCGRAAREAIVQGRRVASPSQQPALDATARGLPPADQPVSNTASACSSASGRP
jgi:tetratricopeptide (TPR) repeat protein